MIAGQILEDIINQGKYREWAKDAHETWKATKEAQGWTYAETRDSAKKTNPIMRPFEELPADVQGQNCLTPYAVVNYFRVYHGEIEAAELGALLTETAEGRNDAVLQMVGEYVHSHFIAAQLAKGATVATRDDMTVYERLKPDVKTWDTESAKKVMVYLRDEVLGGRYAAR